MGHKKDFMARKLEGIALITSIANRRAREENDTLKWKLISQEEKTIIKLRKQ